MEIERLHGRMHRLLMLPSVKKRCTPSVKPSMKVYQSKRD